MAPSLGVVMDPIATIKPYKDSTLAMLLAAQARGWPLWYMELGDLYLAGDRCHGRINAQETFLGWVPYAGDLDLGGLDLPREDLEQATRIDLGEWEYELESQKEWFEKLGPSLPPQLELQRRMLLESVRNARKVHVGKK